MTSDKQLIQTYGIHKQDGFLWLHEQSRVTCLSPGFEGLPSPFEVRVAPRLRCPHSLITPQAGRPPPVEAWSHACAPIPQAGLFWCHPSRVFLVGEAARWMIPRTFDPVVHPWWSNGVSGRSLSAKLTLTNVTPLIITDYAPADFLEILRLASLPRSRALIFSGYPKLDIAEDITPDPGDKLQDPIFWEEAAASYLFNYIQKETNS